MKTKSRRGKKGSRSLTSKKVSHSHSLVAKRVLSPSAKIKKQGTRNSKHSIKTRVSIPTVKYQQTRPLRRSYLTKDLSKLNLHLGKKRPQESWIARLNTGKNRQSNKIHVQHYYRSPRTECKRHGYDQSKCNNDPRCIMSSRGCQMATIGVRHVVKK